jgi:hypothetical protein
MGRSLALRWTRDSHSSHSKARFVSRPDTRAPASQLVWATETHKASARGEGARFPLLSSPMRVRLLNTELQYRLGRQSCTENECLCTRGGVVIEVVSST